MSTTATTVLVPRRRQTGINEVDCENESDSSEVLSVGNEPQPIINDIGSVIDEITRSPRSLISPRTLSSGPVSPESPTSSLGMTASSPGRVEYNQDVSLSGYSQSTMQHRLNYPQLREMNSDYTAGITHGIGNETVCPYMERLYKVPMNVLSLLQTGSCRAHPSQQQQRTVNNAYNCLQHLPELVLHQHRLSVNKILKSESPELPSLREEPHLLVGSVSNSLQSITNAPSNSGNINSSINSTSGNNNTINNNNNTQHHGSLKFSIDNILKADFGRRTADSISFKKSRPKRLSRPVDLSKDFLENLSESSEKSSEKGSEKSSETTARNPSPVLPVNTPISNAIPTSGTDSSKLMQWPAWVYCTRYSDRPSSGPRTRRTKVKDELITTTVSEEKRPRTAFSIEQLARLKREFAENKYLTEQRRQALSKELGLNEAQIKIWFQNKRAKIKKASGQKNPLALQLMAQGLYNHSTVPLSKDELEQAAELQANGI